MQNRSTTQFAPTAKQTYPTRVLRRAAGHIHAGRLAGAGIAVRAGNTRTDSAHNRYQIAPGELVKIEREARRQGLGIAGFYHSHPDHPAQWSTTDFAEAHWLGCSYVITAVAQGKAAVTNSFLLAGASEEDKRFEQETIRVEDEGNQSLQDLRLNSSRVLEFARR